MFFPTNDRTDRNSREITIRHLPRSFQLKQPLTEDLITVFTRILMVINLAEMLGRIAKLNVLAAAMVQRLADPAHY